MWIAILDWWERYLDGNKVRKLELGHRAMLEMFSDGTWSKEDKSALKLYFYNKDQYYEAYKQYYLRWGKKPRVEHEFLIRDIQL